MALYSNIEFDMKKVEFYKHCIGEDEKKSILECLDGLFLTTGSYVNEFEKRLADFLDLDNVVGLSSCTAALHLALLSLGIGVGDQVITTPMTFIATATAILHAGAEPVFIDVEPDTGLLNAHAIEKAITERTRAVIPVHLYGQMCDMKEISKICSAHKLCIIEDAAHCIEGSRDGITPGQLSDAACFSFYATKGITSGEGGALATLSSDLAGKIKTLRLHGMSREAAERYEETYQHWDMIDLGWKYNMDNIQASLLLPQLKKIEMLHEKRKVCYEYYSDKLASLDGINIPSITPRSDPAYHLFTIRVNPKIRDILLTKLGEQGIGVAVNYRAIHLLTYFREKFFLKRGFYPEAEKIGDSTISLPFYPDLSREDMDYVVQKLKELLKHYNHV